MEQAYAFVWTRYRDVERCATSPAKRLFDLVVGAALLALAAPVLVLSAVLVRLTSRGPAVFVHERIGYRCRRFPMYKLRTMIDGAERLEGHLADAQGRAFFKIERDPRTTPVGRLLRRLSLDELPQLYNVVRGDMSLVGPRPLLVRDFAKFPKEEQLRRFGVRPGLTGLWQVSGRSALSDRERLDLDLDYVDGWSLWLDLKILVRTLPAVLGGRGAF